MEGTEASARAGACPGVPPLEPIRTERERGPVDPSTESARDPRHAADQAVASVPCRWVARRTNDGHAGAVRAHSGSAHMRSPRRDAADKPGKHMTAHVGSRPPCSPATALEGHICTLPQVTRDTVIVVAHLPDKTHGRAIPDVSRAAPAI